MDLGQGVRILEQSIVRVRPHEPQQGGLATSARNRDQHRWKAAARGIGYRDELPGVILRMMDKSKLRH